MGEAVRDESRTVWISAAVLTAAAFLQRLALWRLYAPIRYGDTPTYFRLAGVLAEVGLSGYDGTRVPGYPLFLILFKQVPERIWLAQMGLGILITILLFWITWRTTSSLLLSAVVGGSYNLIPGMFMFEANLLSETLSISLILLSILIWITLDRTQSTRAGWILAALGGITVALTGLVRPLFFFLSVWLLPFMFISLKGGWREKLFGLGLYSTAPLLLLGGWIYFIFSSYRMLAPTTLGGYHLVNHTSDFFEHVPEEHGTIREIYLKYREQRKAEYGTGVNAIWDAVPELTEATGWSFFALSRQLQRISMELIVEHPFLYLQNVLEGWIGFWKAPAYWRPEIMESTPAREFFEMLTLAGRGFSLLANALFLLFSLGAVLVKRFREAAGIDRYSLAIGGIIWVSSLLQAMVEHGDNPRFLVPLQMLVIYLAVRTSHKVYLSVREAEWTAGLQRIGRGG